MNIPRKHHCILQFCLKRFSHDGQSKLVWSYDWTSEKVAERSVEKLMAEYDLYTQQTSAGINVSLETGEMRKVDEFEALLPRHQTAFQPISADRQRLTSR